MPTSEARIAANRLNALKSTGPRTEAGKARSRANAVKHGMTGAGIALPAEVASAVDERFLGLQEELAPRTILGSALVRRAAMMTVRLDRSYAQEAAALTAHVLGARVAFDDARMAEAEKLLHDLALAPATNVRRLMAMPEGVDLLIRAWEELKTDLEHPVATRWTYEHYHRADYLHGLDAGNVATTAYQAWTHAFYGRYELLRPERLEGMADEARRIHALGELVKLVDADLDRLREHRAAMDTRGVDAARELAPTRAIFDASKEAILARKYEAAAERGLYRALREFRQVEAEAAAGEAPDRVEPGREPEVEIEPGPAPEIGDELGSILPDAPEADPEPARRDPEPTDRPAGRPRPVPNGRRGRPARVKAAGDGPA